MTSPHLLPTIVYRDAEVVYMPRWVEQDGTTVIKNLASKVFPKPHVHPVSVGIIHGIRYPLTYTDTQYQNEIDATNSENWRGWAPGQAWVSRVLTEDDEVNNIPCVKVHYIIRCCRYGWDIDMPSMGFVGGVPEFVDATGAATTSPVPSDIRIKHRIAFDSTLGF